MTGKEKSLFSKWLFKNGFAVDGEQEANDFVCKRPSRQKIIVRFVFCKSKRFVNDSHK